MNKLRPWTLIAGCLAVVTTAASFEFLIAAEPNAPLPTAEEARARAEVLHETIHATLQVVHREYYREDEGLAIPASTLKKVFQEVADRQRVSMRWLVVDGAAMNTDHAPRDDFERKAAEALAAGKGAYEEIEAGVFRRAAAITLKADCLKCHLPNRKSTEDRTAGLILSLPIESP